MTKAIFFDIGGVITHTDFPALYANFARRVGLEPEFVIEYHRRNLDALILGEIDARRFWADLRGTSDDPREIWLEEMEKVRRVDRELLGEIDGLRKRMKTGVITNLTESRLIADEADGIYEHFDVLALSCRDHLKKPDPEFFGLALARAGAAAEEAVFVDDKPALVAAAEAIGMTGILYQNREEDLAGEESLRRSREKLFDRLRDFGITNDA